MDKFQFPLGMYRHFKGGRYYAYGIVDFADGDELVPLVLHRNVEGRDFARTISNFTEEIERDGTKVRRFEKL